MMNNELWIIIICVGWVLCGKGCAVLVKESKHFATDNGFNVFILFIWPAILAVAALELGKDKG